MFPEVIVLSVGDGTRTPNRQADVFIPEMTLHRRQAVSVTRQGDNGAILGLFFKWEVGGGYSLVLTHRCALDNVHTI